MIDDVLEQIHNFFLTYRGERTAKLDRDVQTCLNDLNRRNILPSSITGDNLARVYSEELIWRINSSWKLTKAYFDRHSFLFQSSEIDSITTKIKGCIRTELDQLKSHSKRLTLYQTANSNLDNLKKINTFLASTGSGLNSKIVGELQFYKKTQAIPQKEINKRQKEYVDTNRIKELSDISNHQFDLSRLLRLCEELNIAFENSCYLSISMILRTILNHVPPIFDCNSFEEVTNNYSVSEKNKKRSFKKVMQQLNTTSKEISNIHLHQPIQKKESLPNFNQVNVMAQLDLLLCEIITILG